MYNKLLSLCKDDTEKKNLKELVQISKPLLDAILKAIDSELEKNDEVDWKDFDKPSWALLRAAKDGYKKGLTKLKEYVII